jgi:hypothetical protein
MTISPIPFSIASSLLDRVEDGNAVNLAALAAWRDAADDPGAVVEALPGEVHRLAPGDALDDEGEVFAEKDAHGW